MGASRCDNLLPSADCCVVRRLKNKLFVFFLLTIDYITSLRPFGDKIRLKTDFVLTSLDFDELDSETNLCLAGFALFLWRVVIGAVETMHDFGTGVGSNDFVEPGLFGDLIFIG